VKTIFVPTDFSEPSFNAAVYACKLSEAVGGKIVLFHSDFVPVPIMGTVPIEIIVTTDELRSDSESHLKRMKANLQQQNPAVSEIELISRYGKPEKEILSAAQLSSADLIVTGMKGGGTIKEMTVGNMATRLMHSSSIPILMIPEKASFRNPVNIVIAIDGKEIFSRALSTLQEIALSSQSAIHIVHIYPSNTTFDKETIIDKVDSHFVNIFHMYDFIESDNVDIAIENYMKENEADLLAIIPRRHSFFEKFFTQNHAKRLAFHANVPVLALPHVNPI
jgi:nucleotide-binding universal stress UspA family protein